MSKHRNFAATSRENLLELFKKIDYHLTLEGQALAVTTLGGVSILLQGFRERATVDIDIANTQDASLFQKICSELNIPVDIITIASTVDLNHCHTLTLFEGESLTVASVTPEDLIKLKLERFRKHDPEDIYAIIRKKQLSYETFKILVNEMLPDYIGNPHELILSARLVAERMYLDIKNPFQSNDPMW